MKLLVSIPAFGAQIYTPCASSLISAMTLGYQEGIFELCQPHFQGDSLIHRARNRAAMYAIEHKFDKLLTLDADISFTYEEFKRIVLSDKDIIGGSYPLKAFPVVVNFNPLPDRGRELLSTGRGYDYDAFTKFKEKYSDSNGLVEVQHLPTGFLCVKTEVLLKMGETSEVYEDFDQVTGEHKRFMHFYPAQVYNGCLLSEDWYFCLKASQAGYKIWFDTNVITRHTGLHTYALGQFFGEVQK